VGVNVLCGEPMNPTADEIREIQNCRGIVAVIFTNDWLINRPPSLFHQFADDGLRNILKTIQYLHDVTGSYENIAVGTDFDGFTDPPNDLQDLSKIQILREALTREHVPASDVDGIMGGNMLRVLQEGWGK
jgi:membrane dipeptidase